MDSEVVICVVVVDCEVVACDIVGSVAIGVVSVDCEKATSVVVGSVVISVVSSRVVWPSSNMRYKSSFSTMSLV